MSIGMKMMISRYKFKLGDTAPRFICGKYKYDVKIVGRYFACGEPRYLILCEKSGISLNIIIDRMCNKVEHFDYDDTYSRSNCTHVSESELMSPNKRNGGFEFL